MVCSKICTNNIDSDTKSSQYPFFAVHNWYVRSFLCILPVLGQNLKTVGTYAVSLFRVTIPKKLAAISKAIHHRKGDRVNFLISVAPSTGAEQTCRPEAALVHRQLLLPQQIDQYIGSSIVYICC